MRPEEINLTTFEETLRASGRLIYTSVGRSMLPLLREGRDVLLIETAPDYRVGDAVLFRRPGVQGRGAYVLHRILRIGPEGYWIVGDNCTDGETVARENVLGVLTGVRRGGKRMLRSTDPLYRLYVACWCRPYRLRFLILRLLRFARRCVSWLYRRLRG